MSTQPVLKDISAKLTRTERRIIDAARDCFEVNGIAKTRLEEVATRAKVSRQTIYKYFANKQDIVDRIGWQEMVKINATLREKMNGETNFADQLTLAIVMSVEIALENDYIMRSVEEISTLPGFDGTNERILNWQREKWRPLLERATRRGQIAPDLDFEVLLHWVISCQLFLVLSYNRLVHSGLDIRHFVRRFMVAPVLAGEPATEERDNRVIDIEYLRDENAALRALVSDQALEIYRLKGSLNT